VIVSDDGDGIRERPRSPGFGLDLKVIAELTADFDVTARTPKGVAVWMRFLLSPAATGTPSNPSSMPPVRRSARP
jgi:hypothetical protein